MRGFPILVARRIDHLAQRVVRFSQPVGSRQLLGHCIYLGSMYGRPDVLVAAAGQVASRTCIDPAIGILSIGLDRIPKHIDRA